MIYQIEINFWVIFCKHLNKKEIFLLTCSFSDYLLSSSNRLASKQEPIFIIRLFLLQSQLNVTFKGQSCSLTHNNNQIWGSSHSQPKEFKATWVILGSCLIRVALNLFYCAIRSTYLEIRPVVGHQTSETWSLGDWQQWWITVRPIFGDEGDRISKISGETTVDPDIFRNFVTSKAGDEGNILNLDLAVFMVHSTVVLLLDYHEIIKVNFKIKGATKFEETLFVLNSQLRCATLSSLPNNLRAIDFFF